MLDNNMHNQGSSIGALTYQYLSLAQQHELPRVVISTAKAVMFITYVAIPIHTVDG